MLIFKLHFTLLFVLINCGIAISQYNTKVKATLLINNDTEYIDIKAEVFNVQDITFSGRYVLTTIVGDIIKDKENTSKNDQKGSVILSASESKIVCNTKISVGKEQKAVALLLIYDSDNKLIGKDRWVINDPDETTPIQMDKRDVIKEREGVSIRGIVTDRTKTKPGKDYFKEFYSLYLFNQIQTEEVTSVEEQFAQGRNTRIEVKVGAVIVAKFFARPSYDYMKKMAEATISNIKKHLLYLENQKKQLRGL